MKTILFTLFMIVGVSVYAGPISDVFGKGVFDTKWGDSIEEVKESNPKGKIESIQGITWYEIENSKEVMGIPRKDKKIHFAFDSTGRLNGVAIYFNSSDFGAILLRAETLFGDYTKGPAESIPYIKWTKDEEITLILSASPTLFGMESIFSIGFSGLKKPLADKKSLGF